MMIVVVLTLVLTLSCQKPATDSLDVVKAFQPEDKYFKASLVSMHFMREVSPIAQIDTTYAQLMAHYNLPADATGCHDGTYSGTSPWDAYDYRHTVSITIKDEKIAAVSYDEIHQNGIGKRGNADYNEAMSVTGTSPAKAYPAYEQQLLDKQNIRDIDSITGASYSNYRFRYAVMLALMQARLAAMKTE